MVDINLRSLICVDRPPNHVYKCAGYIIYQYRYEVLVFRLKGEELWQTDSIRLIDGASIILPQAIATSFFVRVGDKRVYEYNLET